MALNHDISPCEAGCASICQGSAADVECTDGGGKCSEASPGSLSQDQFGQFQIRHRAPQPLALRLKLLQPFQLIAVHPFILIAPSMIGLHRHADLSNRLLNRLALPLPHFNLPLLQHNVLGLLSLSSHLPVLPKAGSSYPSEGTPLPRLITYIPPKFDLTTHSYYESNFMVTVGVGL